MASVTLYYGTFITVILKTNIFSTLSEIHSLASLRWGFWTTLWIVFRSRASNSAFCFERDTATELGSIMLRRGLEVDVLTLKWAYCFFKVSNKTLKEFYIVGATFFEILLNQHFFSAAWGCIRKNWAAKVYSLPNFLSSNFSNLLRIKFGRFNLTRILSYSTMGLSSSWRGIPVLLADNLIESWFVGLLWIPVGW